VNAKDAEKRHSRMWVPSHLIVDG